MKQKNICMYVAPNNADPRAMLLSLVCAATNQSESGLLSNLYHNYLRKAGIIDKRRRPIPSKMDQLKKLVEAGVILNDLNDIR